MTPSLSGALEVVIRVYKMVKRGGAVTLADLEMQAVLAPATCAVVPDRVHQRARRRDAPQRPPAVASI